MRNCPLSLLSCAALLMACQPITPTHENPVTKPKYEINDAAPILPASITPPVSQAHTRFTSATGACRNIASSPVDQNNNQTEIDPPLAL